MTNSRGSSLRRTKASRLGQGIAIAAVVALGMTACASDDSADEGATAESGFGDATIQLAWIKNAEFMGEFLAESNGHFADAGFDSVELLAGPASVEPVLLAGNADMGLGNAISTGTVVASEGAPLKIIGATYQKNPFTILSLAGVGNIATLDDIKGKTIGVQASNLNLWEAFLEVNDIDAADVTMVPVEYDPTALFNGEVDGWFAYLTNEAIDAELMGLDPVTLPLADNGLPFVAETFTVTDEAIEEDREMLKALLVAEIKGWTDAINDPTAAATLTVDTYGAELGLTMDKETLQAEIQATDLVVSDETVENGLFTISEELQEQSIETLAAAGIDLTADQLFDMSLLAEVYEENPELVDYQQ
ncbi:MAG TPA: ABC transporter substrate-binding protein [Glaciihabitans sp.]|nr:ABC transporter substrate-binding protein [Glaciihabitans sp.]